MPNIKSAKKRMKQDVKRTARNRVRKERMRQAIKEFNKAITTGDKEAVTAAYKKALNMIEKAGNKNILHKNNVSRKKSWLARQVNKVAAAS